MEITTTQTWSVPDHILNQLAADLIVTGVEGGINYWASVSDYHWSDERPETTGVTVHVTDEDDAPHQVDVPKMIEAISKLVKGEYEPFYNDGYSKTYRERLIELFREITNHRGSRPFALADAADYDFDAIDADSMMQLACLGEITYG